MSHHYRMFGDTVQHIGQCRRLLLLDHQGQERGTVVRRYESTLDDLPIRHQGQ
ncbi:Uncharacterised protein [Mycobacteroides abscessus subsp. abscessus]|nr:Uncharacterised protein [Mycobacteroides abscessus subsp. abscessus]